MKHPFKKLAIAAALSVSAFAAVAAPVTYTIDPAHTNVIASWSHFGYSNPFANFGDADGKIVYDASDVAKSSVEVTLPLSGLNSFTDKFDQHLRSADFFDAAKFPTATFKSTKVESAGKDKLKVTGNLTIKGITKPVVLDVKLNKIGPHPMAKRDAIGFDATAKIKRTDFDVGQYAPNVGDDVKLQITTEAMVPETKAKAKAK